MSKIFYVNAPDSNGIFTAANTIVSEEFKTGVSFFRFVQKEEGSAEFGLSKKASAVNWGLKNKEILGAICIAENPGFNDAKSIVVLETGKAELQPNGDWKVIKKSKIKYAGEATAEGQAATTAAFCSNCGTQVLENYKFCQKCGKAVSSAAVISDPPPAANIFGDSQSGTQIENLSVWGYFAKCFKKYASFSGRARRKEFWGFVLFYYIFYFGLAITGAIISVGSGDASGTAGSVLPGLWGFATLLPSLAVLIRRLHDVGKSGWIWLLPITPFIVMLFGIAILVANETAGAVVIVISAIAMIPTSIYLLVLCCTKGNPAENKYGPSPI